MKLDLEGKIVVVTGGAAGIGKTIVSAFLSEGAIVAYCGRRVTGSEFPSAASHGTAIDITDKAAVEAWIASTAERFGGIDIVVSNVSAIAIPNTPENWLLTYKTDMEAAVNLVNASLPHLLNSKRSPNIVTIGSISGCEIDFTLPGPYGPFKAALIHYSQSLSKQLAPKGVRVNTVSPGNIYVKEGAWGNIEKENPELFAKAVASNPMGRMGTPHEIADAVLFLSSPLSSFTTGANLVVDGALSTGIHF